MSQAAVLRAWRAFRYGVWSIPHLLDAYWQGVQREGKWQASGSGGYRVKAIDTTGFFRLRLHGCATQHYHPQAGRQLPAIALGIIATVGQIGGQRVAATAPDEVQTWLTPSRDTVRAEVWHNVYLPDSVLTAADQTNPRFVTACWKPL